VEWGNPWLLVALAAISFVLSFIGAAVGLVLGHLRLPLLLAYFRQLNLEGNPAAPTAASNLIISGVGALAGTVRHLRAGRVSWPVLVVMGAPSAAGAFVGSFLFSRNVNPFWSHLIIGLMLVVSGFVLIRQPKGEAAATARSPLAGFLWEALIGLGLGMLAAVTGLMLGSLRLPMMLRVLKIDPRVATGTNMAIGCLTALVSVATYFTLGPEMNWAATAAVMTAVVPPTVLGGYLGGAWTGRLSKDAVRALAGWVITLTGLGMVGGELLSLASPQPPEELPEFLKHLEFDEMDADDD
jgi:uncharacterized membrane protein YfcA